MFVYLVYADVVSFVGNDFFDSQKKQKTATVGFFFFFQADDGIRDAQESRGLGDVYKRQVYIR